MKIILPNHKHIGLIFEPRSGSTAFRNYVAPLLNFIDLEEFLNPHKIPPKLVIDKNKRSTAVIVDQKSGIFIDKQIVDKTVSNDWINTQLTTLDDMASIGHYSIFGLLIKNTISDHPVVLEKIKNNSNIFFLRLKRIDVLYGIISLEISKFTDIWHNLDQENTFNRENIQGKLFVPLDLIKYHLELYIKSEQVIKEIVGEIPVIYYEQWQNNIRNLNKILNLPNKLVSVDYQKFAGNYKDIISNIDEIEDYYKEFVNKHSEYFHDEHIKNLLSKSINEFY
jgi:hypothetical protein